MGECTIGWWGLCQCLSSLFDTVELDVNMSTSCSTMANLILVKGEENDSLSANLECWNAINNLVHIYILYI